MQTKTRGAHTPWGAADHSVLVAPGIWRHDTPSHGGYHVSGEENAKIPPALRVRSGWYEEDCDWALLALARPDCFPPEAQAEAKNTAINWHADRYEKWAGVKLTAAESREVYEREFREANLDNFVVRSAWGDWCETVPKGSVGVCAERASDKAQRFALVPDALYSQRGGEYVTKLENEGGFDLPWSGPGKGYG